jgi:CubicO group peptidase (beta-lactamase class C family)
MQRFRHVVNRPLLEGPPGLVLGSSAGGSILTRTDRPLLFASVATVIACACGSDERALPATERYPQAAAQNVDARALDRARARLAGNPYLRCLLVERNGTLVMEEYFNGSSADVFFDVRSITKSVMSTLVGIAIEKGALRGLDQTVGEVLDPVLPGLEARKRSITLGQLLTMTSGLPWRELNSVEQDYFAWVSSPDRLRWILAKPLEHEPGSYWHYNTGASHIVSAMLTETTGRSASTFAQEQLFGPLDSAVGDWPADPRGYNYGGHGISLQARTLARFGRLLLDGGVHQGRQVVPASWIRGATRTWRSTDHAMPWGSGYGYFFWTDHDSATGRDYYFATGYGGQFVVNVPSANATIVATTDWSGVPDAGANWSLVMGTIVETLLPGLR